MQRGFTVAAALVLGLAGGSGVQTAQAGGQRAAAPRQEELRGRIERVDEAQRELVLDAGDATTQVKVAKDAKITIDGAPAAFGDLKRGEEVRASLDRRGVDPQVVRVEVVRAGK